MNLKRFFDNYVICKGDTVYGLTRSRVSYYQGQGAPFYYHITEYTVISVGRQYLTVRPYGGGKTARFEELPSCAPGHGLYLEEVDLHSVWKERLYPTLELAQAAEKLLRRHDILAKAETEDDV